jgi:hypothetical protein
MEDMIMNNEPSLNSFMQIYNELDKFNERISNSLINGYDYDVLNSQLRDMESSNIVNDENFNMAKFYFHLTNTPFLFNGVYFGYDSQDNDLGKFTGKHEHDNFIKQTNNPIDNYKHMYEQSAFDIKQGKISKIHEKIAKYKDQYFDLYTPPSKDELDDRQDVIVFSKEQRKKYSYVPDVAALQNFYIDKVCKLVETRESFNFSCNLHYWNIDNEALREMNTHDKMQYLLQDFRYITLNANKIDDDQKYSFDNQKLFLTNYLDGKGLGRKTWKNYKNPKTRKLPKELLFYFEIALYLGLPSSDDIESFMNLHGLSMNSDLLYFGDIYFGKETYHIMYSDIKRWIDAGIDYNLLNSMFNMDIQRKESESIAKKPSKKLEPTMSFEI